MNCCSGTDRFFSFFANSYARRLEKKGFEKSQRVLFDALKDIGFENQSVLDIGCGTGFFHQAMVQSGASEARAIDISKKMIEHAASLARKKGLEGRTAYSVGDFVEAHGQYEAHDVVVLDKVICCYPDSEKLIDASTGRCGKSYALSYPRDTWIPRLSFGAARLGLSLAGSGFKPRIYPVSWVRDRVERAGFRRETHWRDYFWISEVYLRQH